MKTQIMARKINNGKLETDLLETVFLNTFEEVIDYIISKRETDNNFKLYEEFYMVTNSERQLLLFNDNDNEIETQILEENETF